jgi:hypothetical protein
MTDHQTCNTRRDVLVGDSVRPSDCLPLMEYVCVCMYAFYAFCARCMYVCMSPIRSSTRWGQTDRQTQSPPSASVFVCLVDGRERPLMSKGLFSYVCVLNLLHDMECVYHMCITHKDIGLVFTKWRMSVWICTYANTYRCRFSSWLYFVCTCKRY